MTLFEAAARYSPFWVCAIGLATLVACLGVGLALQTTCKLTLPPPWRQAIGVLVGLQLLSLVVQLLGMAAMVSIPLLVGVWLVWLGVGSWWSWREARDFLPQQWSWPQGWSWGWMAVAIAGLLTNLLVAIAPSSKIDEIYYHMLLPSRIVSDGALQFYRQPWEGAVLPQMGFQMALTPLHALGYPDASNVVSWGLSLTLAWFGWYLLSEECDPPDRQGWGWLWIATVTTGMYPVVWHVTGGAHAFGDLGTAVAIAALLCHQKLLKILSARTFMVLISLSVLASVTSKVSLLPLGSLVMAIGFWLACWRQVQTRSPRFLAGIIACILLPWLIGYLPICLWTFFQSGSPFGPMFAAVFPHSIYDVAQMQATLNYIQTVERPWKSTLRLTVLNHPVLFLLGAGVYVFLPNIRPRNRGIGLALLIAQTTILWKLLFFDIRLFGGLLHGLLLRTFAVLQQKFQGGQRCKSGIKLSILLLALPWLCLQIYYAGRFIPISLGWRSPEMFYQQNIALYEDYQEIDELLPKDSRILSQGLRLGAVYSPRPIYFDQADLPVKEGNFLLTTRDNLNQIKTEQEPFPTSYQVGQTVYENSGAIVQTYRTPNREPDTGPIVLVKLEPLAL